MVIQCIQRSAPPAAPQLCKIVCYLKYGMVKLLREGHLEIPVECTIQHNGSVQWAQQYQNPINWDTLYMDDDRMVEERVFYNHRYRMFMACPNMAMEWQDD